MKRMIIFIAAIAIFSTVNAQPPNVPAEKGSVFGKTVTIQDAISPQQMLEQVYQSEGPLAVKVKGKVSDVCKMEGCWLKLQTENGNVMVKMKDHAFLVPAAINGKEVVIEGMAEQKIISVDMLKHYAEDAGKSEAEIAQITEPKKEVVINADGVLVL